jgi:hypothetical protein
MNPLDLPFFKEIEALVGKVVKEIEASKPDLTEVLIFFADREEAEWAFDLMHWVLGILGVTKAEDCRFAITFNENKEKLCLVFGNWTVLDFTTYGSSGSTVGLSGSAIR